MGLVVLFSINWILKKGVMLSLSKHAGKGLFTMHQRKYIGVVARAHASTELNMTAFF